MLPRLPESPTLEQVQTRWARFLREYHDRPHSSLSRITGRPTTPLDYYLRFLPDGVRYLEHLALDDLFLIDATRRVNADATFRLASRFWEVRPELVGQRVLVRYNPEDLNRVFYRPLQDRDAPTEQAFPVS